MRGRSRHLQADVDVAARRIRKGANLVCLLDQGFGVRAGQSRQGYGKLDVQAEAAGRAWTDAYRRGHRGVGRHLRAALRGDEFHRTGEAGGVAGGKQLLGIITSAATSAEFLWRGKLHVEGPVERGGVTIAAAGALAWVL
jgi:hypothetical protein